MPAAARSRCARAGRRSSRGLRVGQAEASLPAGVETQCRVERGIVEVGPERVAEIELRIRQVPEQEIADALLATGADEQIRFGRACQLHLLSKQGFVDRIGPDLA